MRPALLAALLLSGCVGAADLEPEGAVPVAAPVPSRVVAGEGEGVVNSVDLQRAFPFTLAAPSEGTLVVRLAKTAPTDAVYWDVRDAAGETIVFDRAGGPLERETEETFVAEVPLAGDYRLLIDHDLVGTPGPVAFHVSWRWVER